MSEQKGNGTRPARQTGSEHKSTKSGAPAQRAATKSSTGGNARTGQKGTRPQSGASKSRGAAASGDSARKTGSTSQKRYSSARDSLDEHELHKSEHARKLADARRKNKYVKRRGLYNIMFYAAIFIAVISIIIVLSVTVLFKVNKIELSIGEGVPYSREEILGACELTTGQNLFLAPIEESETKIKSTLPYIEQCIITRRLPSTLVIEVRPAMVLGAATSTDGVRVVFSLSGRVLKYADEAPGCASIDGLVFTQQGIGVKAQFENETHLDNAAEIVAGFSLYGITLDSISFGSGGAISASYGGRIDLRFGTPSDLSDKIQRAATMITEEKIAKNEAGRLDLSIDGRVVFTPDYLMDGDD